MAIIAYFLDKNFKHKSLLIEIRKVRGFYNGENIIKVIIFIILKIEIISNLEYFITDNVINNNIIIKIVL